MLTLFTILLLAIAALGAINGVTWLTALSVFCVLGLVQLDEEQRQQTRERIREGLRRAGIPITKAAEHYMLMDPSAFDSALNGERKLDYWRLEMLPESFWQEYWVLLARDKGLPDQVRTFVHAMPALLGMSRRSA